MWRVDVDAVPEDRQVFAAQVVRGTDRRRERQSTHQRVRGVGHREGHLVMAEDVVARRGIEALSEAPPHPPRSRVRGPGPGSRRRSARCSSTDRAAGGACRERRGEASASRVDGGGRRGRVRWVVMAGPFETKTWEAEDEGGRYSEERALEDRGCRRRGWVAAARPSERWNSSSACVRPSLPLKAVPKPRCVAAATPVSSELGSRPPMATGSPTGARGGNAEQDRRRPPRALLQPAVAVGPTLEGKDRGGEERTERGRGREGRRVARFGGEGGGWWGCPTRTIVPRPAELIDAIPQ